MIYRGITRTKIQDSLFGFTDQDLTMMAGNNARDSEFSRFWPDSLLSQILLYLVRGKGMLPALKG